LHPKQLQDTDATSYEKLLSGTSTVSIAGYILSLDKRNSHTNRLKDQFLLLSRIWLE
jgi:hypothetical protein